jgi:hypothetical protein
VGGALNLTWEKMFKNYVVEDFHDKISRYHAKQVMPLYL